MINFDKLEDLKLEDLKEYNYFELLKLKDEVLKKITPIDDLIYLQVASNKNLAIEFNKLNIELKKAVKLIDEVIKVYEG